MLRTVAPFFWLPGEGDEPPGREGLTGVLGHDLGRFLVCDAGEGAPVIAVDPREAHDASLVNSSVTLFDAALEKLASWYSSTLPDEAAMAHCDELRAWLALADEPAARAVDGWWSTILEQVEQGLL